MCVFLESDTDTVVVAMGRLSSEKEYKKMSSTLVVSVNSIMSGLKS